MVPGSLVQTAQGPVFQPNPTTVTVVPPARSIQVVGEPEELIADEELGEKTPTVTSTGAIPQVLPQQQFGGGMPQGFPQQYPQGFPQQQFGGGFPQQYPQAYPQQYNINMSPNPAVYASSIPQPAQMYTSGVPGAPPVISIPTDDLTMQQYAMPQGPRPQRGNTTLRRRTAPQFGAPQQYGSGDQYGGSSSESGNTSQGADLRITVIKGN
jgi:hypothetical protein